MKKSIYSLENKRLIAKLVYARKAAALRQLDVATRLKKPQSFVSKVERGERKIDITELKKLAAIYKKEVTYFL